MNYQDFIANKQVKNIATGHDVSLSNLNQYLKDFQRISVKWALKKGRAALFFGTGLGKRRQMPDV